MQTNAVNAGKVVYWHRELPPLDAEPIGEHVVEASSSRVPGGIVGGDELWIRCEPDLEARMCTRLEQEVSRLGGRYAHILNEAIDPHRDFATDEAWLHGRFTYMLYR